MSWSFVLPGQPISLNKAYRSKMQDALSREGKPFSRPVVYKTREAKLWQAQMAQIVRTAKPSRWKPESWVRIQVRAFLTRQVDQDNLLKLLHDVIQEATGVNDKWYLPCFPDPPILGLAEREARLEVTIDG